VATQHFELPRRQAAHFVDGQLRDQPLGPFLIVELVRKGRTPEELAQQFEPRAQAIRNWVKQAALDAGQRLDGLTTEEREELRRLRRENRQLREEHADP
jgi:transposase